MLFTVESIENKDINSINNFFVNVNEFEAVITTDEEITEENNVTKYITSLVSKQYQKSIEDIENTNVGNRIKRKRNLQQVMRESFFYGANRFGNNFIA
jgi:hypothetical protein